MRVNVHPGFLVFAENPCYRRATTRRSRE
jgi:hypothetical protein